MVERRNPPDAIHFRKENENAIASKLGGPPTPPASTLFRSIQHVFKMILPFFQNDPTLLTATLGVSKCPVNGLGDLSGLALESSLVALSSDHSCSYLGVHMLARLAVLVECFPVSPCHWSSLVHWSVETSRNGRCRVSSAPHSHQSSPREPSSVLLPARRGGGSRPLPSPR